MLRGYLQHTVNTIIQHTVRCRQSLSIINQKHLSCFLHSFLPKTQKVKVVMTTTAPLPPSSSPKVEPPAHLHTHQVGKYTKNPTPTHVSHQYTRSNPPQTRQQLSTINTRESIIHCSTQSSGCKHQGTWVSISTTTTRGHRGNGRKTNKDGSLGV
jgi:hypothetical protein